MKSFRNFLYESKVSDSLALLGLDDSQYTVEILKTAYKRAASVAHPDKGGSDKAMRDVRSAYEFLSKTSVAKITDKKSEKADYMHLADIVLNTVDAGLDPQVYTAYFEQHLGKKFTHTREFKKNVGDTYSSFNNVTILHSWQTPDKKTQFYLQLYVNLVTAKYAKGLSNSNSAIFDTQVTPTTYVDGNRKVLKDKNRRANDTTFFANPAKIFTKTSITSKKGKFGKKDMLFGLTTRAKAKFQSDYYYIPLGDNTHHLQVYRTTFMGSAQWSAGHVYVMEDGRRVRTKINVPSLGVLEESEDLLDAFIDITSINSLDKVFARIKKCAWKED